MNGKPGRISHYRVLGELGRDRLGYVLRAADEQLDRPVVLRVVRAASVYPPERVRAVRAAFQREARRAARVSHPNLVTLYAFEAIGDIDLIAMEHVEGASLRAMLALGDRWRVPEAAKLVARIADAVAAAHAAHIAHGRLELANVVIRQDGRVKVLDLGVPKLIEPEHGAQETGGEPRIARATDPGADVAAIGLIAWELASSALRPPGTLWRPAQAGSEEIAAILADPALARARFGVLAPVLLRTLLPADRYRDAAELRDAVLAALAEPARSPAPAEIDGPLGPATRLIVPATAAATPAATGELLDVDATAGDPEAARTPRLVLPADLALSGATPPPGGSFVVMESGVRAERWRKAADVLGDRLSSRVDRVGPGALVAAGLVLVVLLAGLVAARRYLSSGGASAAILAQNGPVTTVAGAPPAEAQPEPAGGAASGAAGTGAAAVPSATGGAGAPAAEQGGEAAPAPGFLQRAMVRASPEGSTIRVVGSDERWRDDVELEVATGDSLLVRFERPGYVPETRVFRGTRLAVSLRPDSVVARFEANVPAEVFLVAANGSRRRLGTTGSTVRLPTGTHRIVYRVPDLPEWTTTQGMPSPGETYTIRKMDFLAEGSLVLTVADTWARVSVDGGPAEDTPARFDRLSAGPHTIRVTREGYVSITDTVVIRAGQQATKHYTLRPAG